MIKEFVVIDGARYNLEESIADVSLGDLFTLKVKSKAFGSGVSIGSINAAFQSINKHQTDYAAELEAWEAKPDGDGPLTASFRILDDELVVINLIGLIFLTKRTAGEQISFEDATAIKFASVSFEQDEIDDEGDAAPKDEAAPVVE